jgi:predicted DNA binding CopG/RHH family protein
MAKVKKIKITINFDSDILNSIKQSSLKTGIPYQTLMNRVLRKALHKQRARESRLDRLEKEIKKLKEKIAA